MGEDKEITGSSSGKKGVHQLNSRRSVSEDEEAMTFPPWLLLLLPALLLLSQELLLALLWTLTPASLFGYGSNLSCLQAGGLLVYPSGRKHKWYGD